MEKRERSMKRLTLVLGLLAVLLSTAFGQIGQRSVLQAKIPFEFVAGSHTLPAGNYNFSVSLNNVQMKNLDTGKTVSVGYMTRIAADKTASGKARITFDVHEGGKHFIEALWPDQDDGYLIHTVKGEHTHDIVRSQ
jgi:hypothetical protein